MANRNRIVGLGGAVSVPLNKLLSDSFNDESEHLYETRGKDTSRQKRMDWGHEEEGRGDYYCN